MSQEHGTLSLDVVRWTFSVDPSHRAEIESHLLDLGLEVVVYEEAKFVVTWEEPDRPVEEVVEELWELNGEPFEVIQEELHRIGLHVLHPADEEQGEAAA